MTQIYNLQDDDPTNLNVAGMQFVGGEITAEVSINAGRRLAKELRVISLSGGHGCIGWSIGRS
jgi:hypothetical protein